MLNLKHIRDRLVATSDFRVGKNEQVEAAIDRVEVDYAAACKLRITFKLGDSVVMQTEFPHSLRDDTCVLSFRGRAYIPVSLDAAS